jgi:hypothetical protein
MASLFGECIDIRHEPDMTVKESSLSLPVASLPAAKSAGVPLGASVQATMPLDERFQGFAGRFDFVRIPQHAGPFAARFAVNLGAVGGAINDQRIRLSNFHVQRRGQQADGGKQAFLPPALLVPAGHQGEDRSQVRVDGVPVPAGLAFGPGCQTEPWGETTDLPQ